MGKNEALERTGVDSSRQMQQSETASLAMAEREKHKIQARYQVALMRPRNLEDVRLAILKDCVRPGFAKVARFSKPAGRNRIEGPSIRFVERMVQLMGNISCDDQAIYDDETKRIVEVTVVDMETNASHSMSVTITKQVERKSDKGRTVIAERLNSYNEPVFVVVATDDELLNKQGSLVSKAIRTAAKRLLPHDIVEEAMDLCKQTSNNREAVDPDKALRKMLDAWDSHGVKASDIEAYLGHPLSQMSGPSWDEMESLHNAVSDGETSWRAIIDSKSEVIDADSVEAAPPGPSYKQRRAIYESNVKGVRAHLAKDTDPEQFDKHVGMCKTLWSEAMGEASFDDPIVLAEIEKRK